MKKTFKSFISILLAIMFLPVFSVLAINSGTKGLTFNSNVLLTPEKTLDTTPNTFEAWVKFSKTASGRGGVILGNYGSGNPCISFEIYTNGIPRLYWVDAQKTVYDWQFKDINVYNGEWTHVAIVRDASNLTAHCYINGELKSTVTIKSNPDITPVRPLMLGGDYRGGNSQYFKGELASAALFSDVRTSEKIKADMSAPGKDSLLLHYDLADPSDTSKIKDSSGNGYDIEQGLTWITDKAPVTDYAFSFIAIGDTQILAEKYPKLFPGIYDFVLDSIETRNLKFVFGLGDITNSSTQTEWDLATEHIFRMDGKVGYSLVRGNHDTTADFVKAFPYSKYEGIIGGAYADSMINSWQTFEVGSIKYLVLSLDYGASDKILEWASEIVESHPEHNVIVTTHCYLYRDGTTLDKNDVCPPNPNGTNTLNNGDQMWEKFVSKHENIVLVLSGHDPCNQIVMTQTKGEKGNTVTQMLIDPQWVDSGLKGVGLVAVFYMSEDGRNVTVEYYSTVKEKYYLSENQFSFTLDLVGEENTVTEPSETTTAPQITTTVAPQETKGCASLMLPSVILPVTAAAFLTKAKKKKKRS